MTKDNYEELRQRVMQLSPRHRVALAQQLSHSSQRLVAYVVPKPDNSTLNPSTLKDFLKSKLPNYMVPAAIVPLETLPRTANGKIDVNALPEPKIATSDAGETPRNAVEETLAQIWQDVLRLNAIGVHDNFFELGGDSILSIQIVSRAREAGLRLAPNQLFEQPTIAELAAVVNLTPEVAATQDVVTGEVPLTPIQQWFFEQEMESAHHWHQAMLVEVPDGVNSEMVEGAIATLWTHHDALRLIFTDKQINTDASNPPKLAHIDLTHLTASDQVQAIAAHGTKLHQNVTLAAGGLMRTALFTCSTNQLRLLLSLHHLVVDAVSWQILLGDLGTLLGGATPLPEKTTSFKSWSETLRAQTAAQQSEADFWVTQVEQPIIQLPRDYAETTLPVEATTQTVTVALSQEDTQALLQTVPAVYNTQINDALLTALAQTLLQWVGATSGNVRIEVEAHGREQITPEIDVSRTVGWFTTTYPYSLQVRNTEDCMESLKSVKEQLRQIPDRGISYGMLRYLGNETIRQRLAQASNSEVLFNYLGQRDSTSTGLQIIQDIDVGTLRDPRNRRGYLLEINTWVANGQLQVNWRYDTKIHRPDTLETLANQYLSALKSLIVQCSDTDSGGFTPSDFPDAEFNQSELDDFIGQLTGEV
ncbi:amino acid adenylation domain protein [Leptolyngbya sp. Heron Island J]|uniref:condensation domain-containing protein n=1 Tax=Leptolyngbya sp. Heron Island J TaxID=1385935 RepID=UPI0003B9C5B1|nr:condensation domain-containing protein [Leptolyngbya sp. Heron Island J]ESA38545.1 amino acid adenylation domain protein [Leptolyngbya sp. Heron Island J]